MRTYTLIVDPAVYTGSLDLITRRFSYPNKYVAGFIKNEEGTIYEKLIKDMPQSDYYLVVGDNRVLNEVVAAEVEQNNYIPIVHVNPLNKDISKEISTKINSQEQTKKIYRLQDHVFIQKALGGLFSIADNNVNLETIKKMLSYQEQTIKLETARTLVTGNYLGMAIYPKEEDEKIYLLKDKSRLVLLKELLELIRYGEKITDLDDYFLEIYRVKDAEITFTKPMRFTFDGTAPVRVRNKVNLESVGQVRIR